MGFRLYLRRRRMAGDFLDPVTRMWVVVAAVLGAAAGSKVLAWFSDPAETLAHWREPLFLMQGKTIIGALLGGTIAVEWTKRKLGVPRRTGDLFAVALAAGIAVGRIGCFLGGLPDRTYGIATSLPWGVDFGDGITRHPTQLYEIAFLLLLIVWLRTLEERHVREGDVFRAFLTAYLAFRLLIELIKPDPRFLSLTTLQWACLAGLLFYWRDIVRIFGYAVGTRTAFEDQPYG